MRSRQVRLEDFVDGLRAFEAGFITKERISEFCAERRIETRSLDRYVFFRDDRYTRHLIYRDDLFEIMVIAWRPGQRTPVHTHNGQLGWMLVERGGVDVTNFRYVSCNAPENQNVVGIDCLGGASQIELETLGSEHPAEGGAVSTVDKIQTIHQIGCPPDTREAAVTVHVYSRPFDSCVTFDLASGSCGRRQMFWDSRFGKRDEESAATPAAVSRSLPLAPST